jgi:hypothetical protein
VTFVSETWGGRRRAQHGRRRGHPTRARDGRGQGPDEDKITRESTRTKDHAKGAVACRCDDDHRQTHAPGRHCRCGLASRRTRGRGDRKARARRAVTGSVQLGSPRSLNFLDPASCRCESDGHRQAAMAATSCCPRLWESEWPKRVSRRSSRARLIQGATVVVVVVVATKACCHPGQGRKNSNTSGNEGAGQPLRGTPDQSGAAFDRSDRSSGPDRGSTVTVGRAPHAGGSSSSVYISDTWCKRVYLTALEYTRHPWG